MREYELFVRGELNSGSKIIIEPDSILDCIKDELKKNTDISCGDKFDFLSNLIGGNVFSIFADVSSELQMVMLKAVRKRYEDKLSSLMREVTAVKKLIEKMDEGLNNAERG